MLMAMRETPGTPTPKPTRSHARRWDAKQHADKIKKRRSHNIERQSMNGLSDVSYNPFNYSSWYQNSYLPNYYSTAYQQVAQPCPQGYTRKVANVYPYQTFCAPTQSPFYGYGGSYSNYGYGQGYSPYAYYGYPYQQPPASTGLPIGPDPYLYYRTPQMCVQRGGLWDSFSQSCSGASGSPSSVAADVAPSLAPNVQGYNKYVAAARLNAAGYEAWLVSEDNSYFNPPPGYDPRRINLWVSNGIVERQAAG